MKIILNQFPAAVLVVVLVLSIIGIVVTEAQNPTIFYSAFLMSYLLLALYVSFKIDQIIHKVL